MIEVLLKMEDSEAETKAREIVESLNKLKGEGYKVVFYSWSRPCGFGEDEEGHEYQRYEGGRDIAVVKAEDFDDWYGDMSVSMGEEGGSFKVLMEW